MPYKEMQIACPVLWPALALWGNKAELTPFVTRFGIHHLAFKLESADITWQDFDSSYDRYLKKYTPIPFQSSYFGRGSTS